METLQQMVAVGTVLGLLAGALWFLRRRGLAQFRVPGTGRGGARQLQAIERLHLTPQHSLHLVRVGEKTVLLAVGPSVCTAIDPQACGAAADFASLLQRRQESL